VYVCIYVYVYVYVCVGVYMMREKLENSSLAQICTRAECREGRISGEHSNGSQDMNGVKARPPPKLGLVGSQMNLKGFATRIHREGTGNARLKL